MRIITVNVPIRILEDMDAFWGEEPDKMYPSRSEFIRAAVRSMLKQKYTIPQAPNPVIAKKDLTSLHIKCQKLPIAVDGKHFIDISKINALIETNKL